MYKTKIAVLIKKTALVFDKLSNQVLYPYDLTHTQFRTLLFLYKSPPQTVRQIDIEHAFSMTNPTVTGILQILERKDLIRRISNPQDKRSKFVDLTDYAYSIKDELFLLAEKLENKMTESLSDQEQADLSRLLGKILDGASE